MYPPIEEDLKELELDKEVEGLDPATGAILPDEMIGDEIDGQIAPIGDTPETNEEETEEVPEEVKTALRKMIDDFDRIEQPVRDRMIRYWKKHELFWKGVQNIFWDYSAKDYRRLDNDDNTETSELDYYYQDKIVNIFRAHGESVASALTQEIPSIIFPPDDADNPDDVQTSKGYTKASELLGKCNNAEYMLMHAIYILWNQGVVGAYNYNLTDEEFGTYSEPKFQTVEKTIPEFACPTCGGPVEMGMGGNPEAQGMAFCPACSAQVQPLLMGQRKVEEQIEVGEVEKPKKREKIELYGPLHFRLPHYVTAPKHTPYVMLDTECHIDYVRELFPDLEVSEEHDLEKYDRWARVSTDYQGELTDGLVTLRRAWLRPWTFNRFKKDEPEIYAFLREHYPSGAKVTLVNDKVAKCEDESLDKHWTFSQSPLSSHIHAEPIGAPLVPIQEMRNELVVLKLQTIEYGIPETFADPAALDFEAYKNNEASPGQVFPAKAQNGQSLESSFATLKTATFPKEAVEFQRELDSDGQFVVGSFPSIYGGSMPSASKTAAEYQMSRNQALQRLQNTWKILTRFWAQVMDKSVRSFIMNLTRDETFVKNTGGSFINVYIRQSEMTGRVGTAEPESAQTFPMSWMQKRDVLIQLMQMQNEYINEALFAPENRGIIATYLGLPEFNVPGEDSRTKQLLEIQKLLQSEPMEMMPPEMGMSPEAQGGEQGLPPMEQGGMPPPLMPTVEVDPITDNHEVEFETIVSWMNSEIGMDTKETNPGGYMNVRAHAEQHYMYLMEQQQAEAEAQAKEAGKNSGQNKPKPKEDVSES